MGAAAVPLMVAGLVLETVSAVVSYKEQKKAAKQQEQILQADAAARQQKAQYDESIHRERIRKILSSQRAAIGKSGVEFVGSPLLALEETVKQGELDALAIRYGGDIEASRIRSQASFERERGESAANAGLFKAGTSLLTGGVKVYEKYKTTKK